MKSEVKGKEKNIVTLEIRVDKEKFDEALEKAYRKNVKQIAIPGFRKGKAPRKFIEKFYGAAVLKLLLKSISLCLLTSLRLKKSPK